jgi:hypothetical protein
LIYGTNDDKLAAGVALIKGDFGEATDVISALAASSVPNSSPGVVTNPPVLSSWNGTGPARVKIKQKQ